MAVQCEDATSAPSVHTLAANSSVGCVNLSAARYSLSATLVLNRSMVLVGDAASGAMLDGEGKVAVLHIADGANVTMIGITLARGLAGFQSPNCGERPPADGGGLFNRGTLTMIGCSVTDCDTGSNHCGFGLGRGGGVFNAHNASLRLLGCRLHHNSVAGYSYGYGYGLRGGGLYNDGGAVFMIACTVQDSSAWSGGSGLYNSGLLVMSGCCVYDNDQNGLLNQGSLLLTSSRIWRNSAVARCYDGRGLRCTGSGGGVLNDGGSAVLSGCSVRLNNATHMRIFWPPTGGTFRLGEGAGISNTKQGLLQMQDCLVEHNTCQGNGGGILSRGNATLTGCLLQHNAAHGFVYAIGEMERPGHCCGDGGGAYAASGRLSLVGCTVQENTADFTPDEEAPNICTGGYGGGIALNEEWAMNEEGGTLELSGCHIGLNRAYAKGGGLFVEGTCTLTNTSFAANAVAHGLVSHFFLTPTSLMTYVLPTPLGTYLSGTVLCQILTYCAHTSSRGTCDRTLPRAIQPCPAGSEGKFAAILGSEAIGREVNESFPARCAPGYLGDSIDSSAQRNLFCSGPW
jgi:predicted outer membrane repeat protein